MVADQVGREWTIDAGETLQALYDEPGAPALLHETLGGAVSWHVRNENSVERAARAPHLAPQWVAALLAWERLPQLRARQTAFRWRRCSAAR